MTTSLSPVPIQRFVDQNGNALTGGKVFTYIAGTTTKQTTYTDSTGGTPNTNPIVLNARGECAIWLTQNQAYKLVLSPSTDSDPPTNAIWTADNVQPGLGAFASGILLGNSSGSSAAPTGQTIGANLRLSGGVLDGIPRGHISGLNLANDAGTPNSVIDISAGYCTNSTNTTPISLGTFTKSTAGVWLAGSGNNGMGTGLVVTASTWYHVFAIINAGAPDVYFDTSVSAANAPSGTTAFRRIGSMKTDGSAHWLTFQQVGDDFLWLNEINDINISNFSSAPTLFQLSVPFGFNVKARIRVQSSNGSAAWTTTVYSPIANTTAGAVLLAGASGAVSAACAVDLITDTSSHVSAYHTSSQLGNLSITTTGWIDTRGRFA